MNKNKYLKNKRMIQITNATELTLAIQQLEQKKITDGLLLKEDIQVTLDNMQPINVIKNTLHDFVISKDIKTDLTNLVLGATTGVIIKNLIVGKSETPLSNITGILVEMVVTKNVSKYAEQLKKISTSFFS